MKRSNRDAPSAACAATNSSAADPTRHFGAHGETITERAERDAATLSIECDSFGLRFNDRRRCAISTKPRGYPRFTALGAP